MCKVVFKCSEDFEYLISLFWPIPTVYQAIDLLVESVDQSPFVCGTFIEVFVFDNRY